MVAAVIAAACGSSTNGTESDEAGTAQDGQWVAFDLFETLPADSTLLIGLTFADLGRAEAAIGATRPQLGDEEGFQEWNRRLSSTALQNDGVPQAFALIPAFSDGPISDPVGWTEAYGFSILDTEAVVEAGQVPGTVTSFVVRVTGADIDAAVSTDPAWSSDLEVVEGEGGSYYQWSTEGEIELERDGPGRPLGRGGLLAVRDDIVVRGILGEEFLAALDAHANGPSLVDLASVTDMLLALDGADTHSFVMVDGVAGPLPDVLSAESLDDLGQQYEEDLESAQLLPFLFAAAGVAVVDGQPVDVVAYAHLDETAAQLNEERIRTLIETGRSTVIDLPWSEIYQVRSTSSVGTVSIAVLEPVNGLPLKALRAASSRDSLFWFG